MANATLIKACLRGQRTAQRQLYETTAPYALTVLIRYGVSEKDQADLLQEIFSEVFTKLNHFDPERGKFTTWLRSITVFRILDYRRWVGRNLIDTVENLPEPADGDVNLATVAPDYLLRHIAALPDGYRTVFNLYAVEGYHHKEIAEMLGISPEGSRSQYHRARQLLQKSLKKTSKLIADEVR